MCLCKGTGGITQLNKTGTIAEFIPCPDTNCTFDREKAWKDFLKWQERFLKECESGRSA